MRTLPLLAASLASAALLLPVTGNAASNVSASDRSFVRTALQSSVAEVKRALDQINSTDIRVRQYAEKMEGDHQHETQTLATIASDLQIDTGSVSPVQPEVTSAPNSGPEGKHPASSATMPAAAYFTTEVRTHRQAIQLFQREAQNGNARLRTFAKQQMPILQLHLRMALRDLAQERRAK